MHKLSLQVQIKSSNKKDLFSSSEKQNYHWFNNINFLKNMDFSTHLGSGKLCCRFIPNSFNFALKNKLWNLQLFI